MLSWLSWFLVPSATIGSIRRRAPRRQRARDDRDRRQQSGDGRQHQRIGGAHAEQLTLETLPQRERAHGAEHEAADDQEQPLAEHQLEDARALLPSAMRMPISLRRCVTRYARTP